MLHIRTWYSTTKRTTGKYVHAWYCFTKDVNESRSKFIQQKRESRPPNCKTTDETRRQVVYEQIQIESEQLSIEVWFFFFFFDFSPCLLYYCTLNLQPQRPFIKQPSNHSCSQPFLKRKKFSFHKYLITKYLITNPLSRLFFPWGVAFLWRKGNGQPENKYIVPLVNVFKQKKDPLDDI